MAAAAPLLVVRAVILRAGAILLVGERGAPEGLYNLPGGKVELGESLEDALARELGEELGLDAHGFAHLGFIENLYVTAEGSWHTLEHIFRVETYGEAVLQEAGMRLAFARREELAALDLRPRRLRDHLAHALTPFGRFSLLPGRFGGGAMP